MSAGNVVGCPPRGPAQITAARVSPANGKMLVSACLAKVPAPDTPTARHDKIHDILTPQLECSSNGCTCPLNDVKHTL